MIMYATSVYASAPTASLKVDNDTVNAGDTFIVTFSATCDDGINGVQAEIEYDSTKLELIELKSTDSSKWTNLGTGLKIEIIHADSSTEKAADIFTVSFKVKEGVENEKVTVSAKDIAVDSDTSISATELGSKQVDVQVSETTQVVGENPDPSQQEVEITDENTEKANEKVEEKVDTTNQKVLDIKSGTTTQKELPKTGRGIISCIIVFVGIVLSILFYVKYKRYEGI